MSLLFIGSLFRGIGSIIWIILAVYCFLDVIKSSMPQNTKLLWILIILIFPFIGSLIYIFWGKNQRINF